MVLEHCESSAEIDIRRLNAGGYIIDIDQEEQRAQYIALWHTCKWLEMWPLRETCALYLIGKIETNLKGVYPDQVAVV